ncbi:MAG: O-antigen ligase family protein, partial [Alphaproteobacteria bacterium]
YASNGLIIEFTGAGTVQRYKNTAYRENLTSTFINRNSYAAYAGISLVLVTSLLAKRLIDTEIRAPRLATRLVLVVEQIVTHHWHLAVSWFVVATALFMTDSRAGILVAIVGLVVFLIAMGFSRSISSRSVRIFAVSIIAVSIAVAWVSGEDLRRRLLGGTLGNDSRFAIYELTLDAISDSPVLGMGYGTYPQVFELYRYDRYEFLHPARKAHNTYLENALELGIPAATLLTIAVLAIVGMCTAGTRRRRRDPEYAAAAVAVSVSLGLHSLIDFSLQIPAVAATFAFLLGLGCAQSWSTQPARRFGARQSEQIPGTRSDQAEVPMQ